MIVVSPYYGQVSENLLSGAKYTLNTYGASYEIVEVSGALEIPLAIKLGISRREKPFDAYLALGCVIRGETSHYDIVCNESAAGITRLSLDHNAPIGNAILTCDTMDQAIVRSDPDQKNKGADAVQAIMGLLELKNKFKIK